MRVALNLEQLLQPAPGGIGRYTAELARLLAHAPAVQETSVLEGLLLEGFGQGGSLLPPLACVAAVLCPRLDPKTLLQRSERVA